MAEGLIGGVLGGNDENSDSDAEAIVGPYAFAGAVAARLSANDPGVAAKTEQFLAEQTRLVEMQRKILEDEHALRLSKLGGQRKLMETNRRGPHWADPLKAWGDLLVKQGRVKDAIARYDEALKFAPTWAALKEARAAAIGL